MAEKRRRIWDNHREIGEVRKSTSIKYVLAAGIRDGVRYINIREFYKRQKDGVWKPGRDGITIPLIVPIDKGEKVIKPYENLLEMLEITKKAVLEMQLYDEEHAMYSIPKDKVKK